MVHEDGNFRAVIAHVDHGIPNWLDPGGRTAGRISTRYYSPAVVPFPVPSVRTVSLAALAEALSPVDSEEDPPRNRTRSSGAVTSQPAAGNL